MKKETNKLQGPMIFSEEFDWPTKIAYALSVLKEGTAGEIASLIAELEGDAAQERVAEVNRNVEECLETMTKEDKLRYGVTLRHGTHTYKLVNYL